MAQVLDIREEKRKMQRNLSRQMTFEQRLNEVFELIDLCFEMKEALNRDGLKKGVQGTPERPE